MKKKILFVDDEENVLQGLRRTLRPMRDVWQMEFVDSGAKALALMEKTPFDVIVSDMRMPGMSGAELLNEVMQRFPKTVRFILSGQADLSQVLRCSGSAHQFLCKPCDIALLKASIHHVDKLQESFQSEKIKELVARIDRLPSIPSLYFELVDLLKNPKVSASEIGAIIAQDMAMTAKILKLVNSAFFGRHVQLSSTADATIFLGVETIRSLVLSVQAFTQFEGVKDIGFNVEALWNHSLETAATAKAIARREGSDEIFMDQSYVGGILHDIGTLVMAANFPQEFREVTRLAQAEGKTYLVAEEEVFGTNHAAVGGCLLDLWGLPAPVVDAVCFHHTPGKAANKRFSPLTAVHAANVMVHLSHEKEKQTAAGFVLDADYFEALGFTQPSKEWCAEIPVVPFLDVTYP